MSYACHDNNIVTAVLTVTKIRSIKGGEKSTFPYPRSGFGKTEKIFQATKPTIYRFKHKRRR